MPRSRPPYTAEFRAQMVASVRAGGPLDPAEGFEFVKTNQADYPVTGIDMASPIWCPARWRWP